MAERVSMEDVGVGQRDRLAFIDLRLRFVGVVGRQDVVMRFGIQVAAATRDLKAYRDLAPRNLDYDARDKVYVRGAYFRPLFGFDVDRVMTWLARGYGDEHPAPSGSVVPCEVPDALNRPELEVVSVVTRAIHHKRAVRLSYRALSSGLTSRDIAPFALASSGTRWHARAFDRRTNEFRDFVLTRIVDAELLDGPVALHETVAMDIQWNRVVEMELAPHPANVQHPDTVEADYGMQDGLLRVKVRAALAGYVLRHWNVDCSPKHSLKGPEYQLCLRNHPALYGVANLVLAPGYETPSKA